MMLPTQAQTKQRSSIMERYESTVAFIITFFVGLALVPYVALLGFCGA